MNLLSTRIPGLLLAELKAFEDSRGRFMELHRNSWPYLQQHGLSFVQDNLSISRDRVLRGLHGQHPGFQGKLVTCLSGAVFDVAVDVRLGSPTFGEWEGYELSEENCRQFYIPEGFLHGFVVLRGPAALYYKVTQEFSPQGDFAVKWDDPDIGVDWPVDREGLVLSDKDRGALSFAEMKERLSSS